MSVVPRVSNTAHVASRLSGLVVVYPHDTRLIAGLEACMTYWVDVETIAPIKYRRCVCARASVVCGVVVGGICR
jgi:hypothetical protein